MSDGTTLSSAERVQVALERGDPLDEDYQETHLTSTPIDPAEHLKERKEHLAELERRVKRDDYSPPKMARYREALARAQSEVKALEKDTSHGHD